MVSPIKSLISNKYRVIMLSNIGKTMEVFK